MHDDPAIAAVLQKLHAEDPGLAGDASSALDSLTWGNGPEIITQQAVQRFCWYVLPTKFLVEPGHHRQIVDALARALELLGLDRYASVARSDTTAVVLAAYERDGSEGFAAFRAAEEASGLAPPELDDFAFGTVMGLVESGAFDAVADHLELAIASGALVPGARGWKARQAELVRQHLALPQVGLAGRSIREAVVDERVERWVSDVRDPAHRSRVESIAAEVRVPPPVPAGVDDPLPSLRWLLDALADGQRLTKTGNLNRAFVREAAPHFAWDWPSPPNFEHDCFTLVEVRALAQRAGLARASKGVLVRTKEGARRAADAGALWERVARFVLPRSRYERAGGEALLVLLAASPVVGSDELDAAWGSTSSPWAGANVTATRR